jgi:hypothetical protein
MYRTDYGSPEDRPKGSCERCRATRYPEDGCLLKNCQWEELPLIRPRKATNRVRYS